MLHWHDWPSGIEVIRGFVTFTDFQHKELEGVEVGTKYERETWESRLELVHDPIGGFHGVFGLQYQSDEFSATGEEAFIPETDSEELGIFLVEDFHSGDWTFELGARVDLVDRDPDSNATGGEDFTSLSLSGSALWELNSTWRLGASLSSAQRAPTTEELFSNVEAEDEHDLVVHAATGVIEIGDTSLDEETSLNLDLSVNWAGADGGWAELSFFYNSFEDYIFLLNSGEEEDETPIYLYSQDDAEFYGFEFDSEFPLTSLAGGEISLGVFGDMVSGEFDDAGDVPRLPPMRGGADLNWRADAWSAWVRVQVAADQDDPGDFETETEGYTRWDMGADYRMDIGESELLLFLKWKNVSDDEIRLSTSFLRNYAPEAGQSVEAGIRYSF